MDTATLTIIVGGLMALVTLVFRASVAKNQEVFDAAMKRNDELEANINKYSSENTRLTTLDVVSQRDIIGLQKQIDKQDQQIAKQDKDQISLRQASDMERQQFNDKIKVDADTIKHLQQTIEKQQATIDKQETRITGLELQIKDLNRLLNIAGEEKAQMSKDSAAASGTTAQVAIEAVKTAIEETTPTVNITPGPDVGIAS